MKIDNKVLLSVYIQQLTDKKIEKELLFAKELGRKWRFDFAIPELKLAFEYEGIFSAKARHTTVKGYMGDCEKYNTAVLLGWKVLRFTAGNFAKKRQKETFIFLERVIKGF